MSPQPQEQSLFDRLGGAEGVATLVSDFYDRVLSDPELSGFFLKSDMSKLRKMQIEFFSAALGGPAIYSGGSLRETHAARGINKRHLRLFVDHLIETLQSFDLDENDVRTIYDRVGLQADEITGGGTESG